jgi:murein DD-endopeptidase MepM/ murein hydrolase activator NlpD
MAKTKRFRKITKVLAIVAILLITCFLVLFYYATPVTKNLDSYTYELPFRKGSSFRIVQGYGGLFSHQHAAALDFDMPTGTTVCAARAGTVYRYRDSSNEGGPHAKYLNKANYIIIKHADGSFGCYVHLQKNGVLVKQGRVSAGQPIGLSGGTGYALRPHLHFAVKLALNNKMDAYVRTKFNTAKGTIFLKPGSTYE